MPVPKLYSVLPLENNAPDLDALTSLHSGEVEGGDGEKYCLLSYFPEKLKLSQLNNFVINKYVLFVLDENEAQDYTVEWSIDVTEQIEGEDISVLDTFIIEDIPGSHDDFEFTVGLRHEEITDSQDWELKLTTTCVIFKNGTKDKTIELDQKLLPIEADLLSSNGASFEDETGKDNSAVFLGNEGTTHFVHGHLGEYLVAKKDQVISDSNDPAPDNASVFVNQTAAIAYINALSHAESLGPSALWAGRHKNFQNPFNLVFANPNLEALIINQREYDNGTYGDVGICSLNLHHVLPIVLDVEFDRVDFDIELLSEIETAYNFVHDDFIIAYHKSIFPKSAIGLSVDIFEKLFAKFKADADLSNHIYETYETIDEDKKAKITDWKNLDFSELRDRGNDRFMKNLISDYYLGHYHTYTKEMIAIARPDGILKIDWSQFIQKILNPSTITVPFTLIKIQVRDLRSGNPIKNALVERIEFFSYDEESTNSIAHKFPPEINYKYETFDFYKYVNNTYSDSGIPFDTGDSKMVRLKKILRLMKYYSGAINSTYNNDVRKAIFDYLTSSDRYLPTAMDAPVSATSKDVDPKKEVWIDYIIQDFEANCLTDGDGVLNCRIPDELLKDRKLKINVGFAQFSVVREIFAGEDRSAMSNKPLKRSESTLDQFSTGFNAEWDGNNQFPVVNPNEQNLDWDDNLDGKNFGWRISDHNESTSDYLKIAISLDVKKSKTEDYNFLKIKFSTLDFLNIEFEDYSHFSTFYEETGIHFVLFGMLFSQPVWAPLKKSVTHKVKGGINPAFMIDFSSPGNIIANPNDGAPQGLSSETSGKFDEYRPYVVTRYLAGSAAWPSSKQYSRGRDYGTLVINGSDPDGNNSLLNADELTETTTILTGHYKLGTTPRTKKVNNQIVNKTHYGMDYYAVAGESPVFAIVGGIISRSSDSSPALFGNRINHMFGDYIFTYAHLSSRTASSLDIVKSGQKIGVAGRTSVQQYPDYAPTHLHFEMAGDGNTFGSRLGNPKSIAKKLSVFGEHSENGELYLNNASHRLFPCDCSGGTEVAATQNCHIKNPVGVGVIPNICWAARNLHCPYMRPKDWNTQTAARKNELNLFRIQSQLTYLFEDDSNKGVANPNNYLDPDDIDGVWDLDMENAISRFRLINISTIEPVVANRAAAGTPWWTSQPAENDATWNQLNVLAPYPRTELTLNRVDQ